MDLDVILIILSLVCMTVGIIGCVIPIIPGLLLSLGGILIIYFGIPKVINLDALIYISAIVVGVTILEFLLPVLLTKKMGGTKYGQYAAMAGLVAGIFFGPLAMILFPLVATLLVEWVICKKFGKAFKAAVGSLIGFLLGTILKLVVAVSMLGYAIWRLLYDYWHLLV